MILWETYNFFTTTTRRKPPSKQDDEEEDDRDLLYVCYAFGPFELEVQLSTGSSLSSQWKMWKMWYRRITGRRVGHSLLRSGLLHPPMWITTTVSKVISWTLRRTHVRKGLSSSLIVRSDTTVQEQKDGGLSQ
jgi:hypothetical protein